MTGVEDDRRSHDEVAGPPHGDMVAQPHSEDEGPSRDPGLPDSVKAVGSRVLRSAPPLNERRPRVSIGAHDPARSRAFSGLTLRSHGQRIYGRPVCSSPPPEPVNVSAAGYSAPTCYPPTAQEVRSSFTPRSSIRGSGKSARSTFASLLMEQFGGANGELTAACGTSSRLSCCGRNSQDVRNSASAGVRAAQG